MVYARNAEKLITPTAIPAYDPISRGNIILIISYTMDVWVIKACFWIALYPTTWFSKHRYQECIGLESEIVSKQGIIY